MSEVLDELARSDDPIDRELARTLRIYQDSRALRNLPRSIGYEPRDIRSLGAVEVIERRIGNLSSGFDEVPAKDSYEAIVLKYPTRFKAEIVTVARDRIGKEEDAFRPTADPIELDRRVRQLLDRTHLPFPSGTVTPQKVSTSSTAFLRDPRVKAYVLKRARGRCEACGTPAPFKTLLGLDYLEVHHMKALAEGGSDRVQNAVALCPNCHRALHYASDAAERANRAYKRIGSVLIRE
jgi:5-methylcytosine-specific restriction protein A